MTPLEIRSEERPFANLGEQLRAVMRASNGDHRAKEKLLQVRAAAAGGSEAVPSDGGFLVFPDWSAELLLRAYNTGAILKRCLNIDIGSSSFKRPQFDESSRVTGSRLGGVQSYWEDEAQSLVPTTLTGLTQTQKPAFNNIEVKANKLTGFLYLTSEVDADSDAFGTWASYAFGQELLFALENAIIQGTGAGQPEGIMNSPALITVAATAGQASGTVTSQNIYGLLQSFWSASYNSAGSVILYNGQLLPQLAALATIVGTAGGQSSMWSWCPDDDNYDRLCGFAALNSEYCSQPGTPGDIILADLSRFLVIKRSLLASVSLHLLFLSDQNAFRWVARWGGQTIDRSPVTAMNASPPLVTSSFVALAKR